MFYYRITQKRRGSANVVDCREAIYPRQIGEAVTAILRDRPGQPSVLVEPISRAVYVRATTP